MAHLHNGTQLILCDGVLLFIGVHMEQAENALGQLIYDEDHRRQYLHDHVNGFCKPEGHGLRIKGGAGLWGDLAEDQDQQRQDPRSNTHIHVSEGACHEDRRQRRGGDIYNIVADQDRA